MERETRKIITPVNKVEITVKSWLNGGEKMEMTKVEQKEMVEWLLKTAVVSPDIKTIKELHGKDFDFLLNELNSLASESSWSEEKKDLPSNTEK